MANEKLDKAIAKALEKGKQPFNFKDFAMFYLHDVGSCEQFTGNEPITVQRHYMRMYYMDYPNAMTVREFADILNQEDLQA